MDRPRFSEEQMAIFKRMVTPTLFDPGPIRRKYLDVQYGTLPEQKVDVYLPDEGDGPFPLIIYVHGGGWSMGSKREGALPCIIDAIKYGYAVISVDYRLAPGVKFPEFLFESYRIRLFVAKGIGNVYVRFADIIFVTFLYRSHVGWNFTKSIVFVPREKQSRFFALVTQRFYDEITRCNVSEITNMNRSGRAYTRGANVFFFIGFCLDYLLGDLVCPIHF